MRKNENRLILILFILAVTTIGCGLGGTEYGVKFIESPNGEKLYFRRAARGLNYDTLSLSKNPDYCSKPEPDSALIFHGLGPITVFYKFEGNELHLYSAQDIQIPPNFSQKVNIIQHPLTNPQFIELRSNYKEKGLEISDVQLGKTLFCIS